MTDETTNRASRLKSLLSFKMGISGKLFLSFSLILGLIIGFAVLSALELNEVDEEIKMASTSAQTSMAQDILPTLDNMEASATRVVTMGVAADELYIHLRTIKKLQSKLVKAQEDPVAIEALVGSLKQASDGALSFTGEIRELIDTSKRSTDESGGDFGQLRADLQALDSTADFQKLLSDIFTRVETRGAVALAVIFLISVVLCVVTSRSISKPLAQVVRIANRVAEGDLVEDENLARLSRSAGEVGEISRAFLRMGGGLREMVGSLQHGTRNLASSAAQIGTTARQGAASAAQQASTVTEVSTTTEEILQTSKAATASAESVLETSEQATERGRDGLDTVEEAVTVVEVVSKQVGDIASKILQLSEQNDQIGEIVETVNDLAEQSNLLAVNASIEASKAGEHGRGFAVVAAEVRNLSEQSKRSTQQIRTILAEIQKATQSAVMSAEEGTKRAEDGRTAIEKVRGVIHDLAGVLEENADRARQISGAASQQSSGIEEVSKAMEAVSQASEDSTSGSKDLERAAGELSALAEQLDGLARQYTIEAAQ